MTVMMAVDRASTYIGTIVVLLALLHGRFSETLFPLALTVCLYGSLDSMLIRDMTWPWRIANLVSHACIPLACKFHGHPRITLIGLVVAAAILLVTLGIYVLVGHWPYVGPKAPSFLLVTCILGMLMVRCEGL